MLRFFSAVGIVVCEHWMIASLCDVVLLVNAFGNTWSARFFFLFKLQLSLSIRYQTTAKLWTTLFLPHITSHPKHTKRQRHFFRPQTTFCDCFFFPFFWKLWHATHNGIQLSVCKYWSLLKFLRIEFEHSVMLEIGLKSERKKHFFIHNVSALDVQFFFFSLFPIVILYSNTIWFEKFLRLFIIVWLFHAELSTAMILKINPLVSFICMC